MDVEILHPSALSSDDADAWASLQASIPAFANPLLGPDFARAVGVVREDARVALWRNDDGAAVGFLAFHRRPGGFARPIGTPFSDYHALVAGADFPLDGAEALRQAGVGAYRFASLIDPFGRFAAGVEARAPGHQVVLRTNAEDYLAALRQESGNRWKNHRRYSGKIERELGALRVAAPDRRKAALHNLINWKRAQLARTGLQDVLRPDWARKLMQRLFQTRTGRVQGLMISLYAGDRHIAGQFGIRQGAHFHPWLAAVDPELTTYSPGSVLQWDAIAAMSDLGLRTYDLGPSFDHWKRLYASTEIEVASGLATAAGVKGAVAGSREAVWTVPGIASFGPAGRLRRRLDQIATVELTLGGRVRGLAEAFASYDRRTHNRPPEMTSAM